MLSNLRLGLRAIFRRDAAERELDDELRFHLDRQVEKYVASGVPRDEAIRRARVEFGGVAQVKEDYREVRGLWLVDTIVEYGQEVRHAFRMLLRAPAFTAVAALSLALGIGANSALFSLHDAILFRPLPVSAPGSLVAVTASSPDDRRVVSGGVSYPNYRDLRDKSQSFDGMIAYRLSSLSFARSRRDVREMRMGTLVSDNFFDVLGIQPALGRRFTPAEGSVPGRDAVVVLGHDFWKNVLAADHSVLGGVVLINGIEFTVIGVAPESFTGMDVFVRPAFYVPIMMAERLSGHRENPVEDRKARSLLVRGRLKPGVSQQGAHAELTTLWKALERQYPEANQNRTFAVRSELQERIRVRPSLATLAVMMTSLVTIVLLIACANVANLMLGRASARSREIAVRLALGVSRMRLLRQLLTESALLALLGGVLGLGFAYAGIRFLSSSIEAMVGPDLPVVIAPRMDYRVLAVSLLASAVSAVLFGLAPGWQSLKTQLVPALKSADTGQTAGPRTIGRNVLVVAQIALSMVLLVAAGMLQAGFRKALDLNPGFQTDHLLMMSTDTSFGRYTPVQTREFYRNLVERARALPGVTSVTLTSAVPLNPDDPPGLEAIIPEGYQLPRGQDHVSVRAAAVDERYFSTIGTEIVRGRAFTVDDKDGSRQVAIVNQELAKTYWPNQDPIGKRIRLNDSRGPWLEVVGVAQTGKYVSINEQPTPFFYKPFGQDVRSEMSLLVETANADAATIAAPLREVVRTLDENQPVLSLQAFSRLYEQQAIAVPLLLMQTIGLMGTAGLTLALVGLYGLVAYSVARRTREIGIRMAIGAGRSDVLRMVLRQGLMLSIVGILVGGVASMAVTRLLAAGMAGVGAPNPGTYVVVPLMVIGLTLAASYLPARRASRVDPLRALRYE